MARFARFLLLLSPAIGLIAAVVWFIAKPAGGPTPAGGGDEPSADGGGKLVVMVVFDQMRGDYVERWKQHFGPNGFERLKREGVWFSNAHVPYAAASTGPGHASLATGAPPSVHGIIENRWYDRGRGKIVLAPNSEEAYDRVPPAPGEYREKWPSLAPTRLLAPTVGETLIDLRKTAGRAFSLSLKARSALLMAGQQSNGAYCFDTSNGEFHTTSFYRKTVPSWVDGFNRSNVAAKWSGKNWDRLKPAAVYEAFGPDDVPGEGGLIYKGRRTFPHPLPDERKEDYYTALEFSGYGNDLLWAFAKAAIDGEKLGRNGTTDLLCVSFSTNDLIGHAFGPDSHEVMDITLRSDQMMAELLAYLDEKVGRDRYSLVMTADHGVCPIPEVSVKDHPTAKRLNIYEFTNGLDDHLDKVFGKKDDVPGQWLEKDAAIKDCYPWLYLNRRTIEALGVTQEQVENAAAAWLRERSTPLTVFTRTQLTKGTFPAAEKEFGVMAQLSFHPDRAGDLYLIPPAFDLALPPLSQGSDHGTPHEYDRHMPILAYGVGVKKTGERKDAVSSLIVAPLVSKLLGINAPAKATEKLPAGLDQ